MNLEENYLPVTEEELLRKISDTENNFIDRQDDAFTQRRLHKVRPVWASVDQAGMVSSNAFQLTTAVCVGP